MTNNKLKYYVLTAFGLIIMVGVFLYYKQIKVLVFNLKIPKNVSQTGAILTTATPEEILKSTQLYELLNKSVIITDNFTLTPYPKSRVFEVKLHEPAEDNKIVFYEWLSQNGYKDIDSKKFIFSK